MERATAQLLDNPSALTVERLVDLNDCAVNELREETHKGRIHYLHDTLSPHYLGHLINEERPRVRACASLVTYLKASRAGSAFRINRRQRTMVYVVIRTQDALH